MTGCKRTLKLVGLKPKYVARTTRETVAAGGSVVWVWHRDKDFKASAAALGDWTARYGGMWRIGDGQSMAYFSATDDTAEAMKFFVRSA